VKLVAVERGAPDGRPGLTGRVERADGARLAVYFAYGRECADLVLDEARAADAFVPALLLPAMAAREPLEIVPAASPRLLAELDRLQAIFASWFPRYTRIEVRARPRDERGDPTPAGVGAFFSGGVDSFYTLRRRPPGGPAITHLLFFHGLETTLELRRGAEAAEARARRVAGEAGVSCVVGETNLRTAFPLLWGEYCGGGLAAAGLSLGGGLGRVLVPSTDSYADAEPWGSHPLVDPLWSTERTAIVSDGAEATRSEKLESLASDPLATRHLRVCLENEGGDWNCGRCTKCVRTAVALFALGVVERFETLPHSLPEPLEPVLAQDHAMYLEQNLALLARTGREPALEAQLRRILRRRRRRDALRTLVEESPAAPLLAWLRRLRGLDAS